MKRFLIALVGFLALFPACGGSGDTPAASPDRLVGGSVQGVPLVLTAAVSTIAGGTPGVTDCTVGTFAEFGSLRGMTTDGQGNLYVADTNNHTIRKIVIATGAVTTIAGTAGSPGMGDNTGLLASFNEPASVTSDGTNLFVADRANNAIRKIVIATREVTTIAGGNVSGAFLDATGRAARFDYPQGITTDGVNLYVSDSHNYRVRKVVIATGVVSTLAGFGTQGIADGPGNLATFGEPRGLTTDGTALFLADSFNNSIRKVMIGTGLVTTLAGDNTAGTSGSIDNVVGTMARFNYPVDITSDGTNLYVSDTANHTIRKVVMTTGEVTTLAGTPLSNGFLNGPGSIALFDTPRGITTDGRSLFLGDGNNYMIREIQ